MGPQYRNLRSAHEARLDATLRTYFAGDAKVEYKIASPFPPPCYFTNGIAGPKEQPFIKDHTGTPFMFYLHGLSGKQRTRLLSDMVIPTNFETYMILDPTDFISDFAFTIDGLNAPPTEQGQKMVEKLLKDKLYMTDKVWTFLSSHHDAIPPSVHDDKVLAMVILSLIARSIWIEGRCGEPGCQGWNIWIPHPSKIPCHHVEWLNMLKSAFPIRTGSGFGGTARLIKVPFFCKGCKGTSHPTMQCPIKEQLGDLL
ncbi:uncharacterized protein EV420DRAFT_1645587 [Desarmillaria tabescens]|uniref:Uncharacterized protein n=1 Tax=Armillaria tabescens TaxID=1929756 RepID=A0AA39K196_ARMTA|nr:uncharacterized protein EV420DRAFT_1645587 [Desarmillaria tabescens]KAK0452736.1 hypothetical protein EV420DRAFT_1645587 [Desarmillaria tabescens]